jgi:hypothetical protein
MTHRKQAGRAEILNCRRNAYFQLSLASPGVLIEPLCSEIRVSTEIRQKHSLSLRGDISIPLQIRALRSYSY